MSRKKLLKSDQLPNFSPVTIGDRINYAAALKDLSSPQFCKMMEISTGNLNGLINDDSKPSAGFLARMLERLRINTNWLLTGEGPIFTSESTECSRQSPKIEASLPAPVTSNGPGPPASPQGFRISDAMAMAARVLESGTTYAIALYLNIEHFDRAIQAETRVTALEARVASLENEILLLKEVLTKCVPRDAPDEPGESVAEEGRPASGRERVA